MIYKIYKPFKIKTYNILGGNLKVSILDKKIIIYLLIKNNICWDNNKEIEEYLKKIILSLKKRYNLILSGLYNAYIYQNKNYGLVIELVNKEELELFPNLIDLNIKIIDDKEFFLKIDDYFLIDNKNKYYYKDYYYINIDELSFKELINLSEFGKIIYGINKDIVKNKGQLL